MWLVVVGWCVSWRVLGCGACLGGGSPGAWWLLCCWCVCSVRRVVVVVVACVCSTVGRRVGVAVYWGCSLWSVVVFGAWLGDGFGGSPLGWCLTLVFTLGLTLPYGWWRVHGVSPCVCCGGGFAISPARVRCRYYQLGNSPRRRWLGDCPNSDKDRPRV